MKLLTSLFLSTALVAGTPVKNVPSNWTFGVTGGVVRATSDALKEVTNDKAGLSGGLHATYKFAKNQAVRVRADYSGYPTTYTKYTNVYTLSTKANVITGEADYLFYPKKNWYLTAGVGASHWQNQYHGYYAKYFGRKDYLEDASVSQPLVSVGTGYEIPVNKLWVKTVAVEARFLATQFGASAKSNAAQVGVVVSF